jgi:Domain of unknown function (DUF4349)
MALARSRGGGVRARTLLPIVALVALAGCGSASSASLAPGGPSAPQASTAAASSATDLLGQVPGGAGTDGSEQGGDGGAETPGAPRDEAKIVYTGSLQLVVGDLDEATTSARQRIDGLGGYVGGSREELDATSPTAIISFRIPAARWDEGVAALRGLATKVVREQTAATEVTGQIVDLEARIRNLRSSETALQGIAAGAANVSDLLEVQKQLTEVRGEIERLDASRAALVDQTAYGTLDTTFGLEEVAVKAVAEGWDPSGEADRATATLVGVLQALATAGIWFLIVWLPILLLLGIVIAGGAFVVRRTGLLRPRAPVEGWPPAPPPAAPA